MSHTPGPWYLVEHNSEIRIYPSSNGGPRGVAVTIGSTALSFRARRQGSHRGEKMVYRPFSEQDRADACLIAAAPELLAAVKRMDEAVMRYGHAKAGDDAAWATSLHDLFEALKYGRTIVAKAEAA